MSATTFYIEYLINGAVALIWLYLGFGNELPQGSLEALTTGVGAFALIPIAYVLGIVVEAVGSVVLETPLRNLMSDNDGSETDDNRSISRTVLIFQRNKDVGAQIYLRRSRDRIVRGTIVNVVLIWFFLCVSHSPGSRINLLFAVLVAVLCVAWYFFHKRTRNLKRAAFRQLKGQGE